MSVESAVAPVVVSVPEMRTLPVVVAPPLMVSPLVCVPPPIVVEAFDMNPAKVGVPVKIGFAEKTTEPVPVSSLKRDARSAEVAIEEEESLEEKVLQSAAVRSPLLVAEEFGMLKVTTLPLAEMVKSEPVVLVASVTVGPDCVCPSGPNEVTALVR